MKERNTESQSNRKGAYDEERKDGGGGTKKERKKERQRERFSTVGRESARYSLFKAWSRVGATVAGSVGPRRVLADRARALVARSRRERRAAPRRASNSHFGSIDGSIAPQPPPAARSFQKSARPTVVQFLVDRRSLIVDRFDLDRVDFQPVERRAKKER